MKNRFFYIPIICISLLLSFLCYFLAELSGIESSLLAFAFASLPVLVCLALLLLGYAQDLRTIVDERTFQILRDKNRLEAQHCALRQLATSKILSDGELQAALRELSEIVSETLKVAVVSVWEIDQPGHLVCRELYDAERMRHTRGEELALLPLKEFLEEAERERVLVSRLDERHPLTHHLSEMLEVPITSILDAAVYAHGQIVALLSLAQIGSARPWTSDERNFAGSVASLVSIAIQADEKRRIKDELERRSMAIEAAADGMAILNSSERYTYVNRAHAHIYGYNSPAELIGQHWSLLYEPQELARFEHEWMPQFRKLGEVTVEAIGRKRDGTHFPQEVSLTALPGGGLICVVRDITARKVAEERATSTALFGTLNPSPEIRFDKQGRIISANPAAHDLFGQLSGSTKVFKNLIGAAHDIDLDHCIEHGSVLTCSSKIGERYYHFLLRGVPELNFGHAYGTDITNLKRAQEKLIESKKFLRRVIDTDPNLIFVKDIKGRFTLVNQAVADVYGTTVGDLIGKTDADFNPKAEEVEHFHAHDQQVIETLQDLSIPEERVTTAKGEVRWFQTVKRPLRLSRDDQAQVLGVAADITDRKLLQDQLFQSQKMEAIGQLAGGIAHDFNNLLTGILGYTGLLKMTNERNIDVYRTADAIEAAATKAAQLTQKLLGFARKGKHQNIPIDLHATIDDTIAILTRTIEQNITLSRSFNAVNSQVQGDPVQLQQMILNLAINARDAMSLCAGGKDGGELKISTRLVNTDLESRNAESDLPAGTYLEIAVTDTGCGIPECIQTRVFEPFFTTKNPDRGTGMGLAMVYGIVKSHGGSIKLESKPLRGTTFRILLPSSEVQKPIQVEKMPAAPKPGHGRVLLVDDHSVVREVAAKMLLSLGYQVVTASDGKEALEYYTEHSGDVDLVILDMIMPRMGAKECFRGLKAINPAVRAILSTGYVNNNAVQEILSDGMAGFIQKPFQMAQLSQIVSEILNRPRDPAPPLPLIKTESLPAPRFNGAAS